MRVTRAPCRPRPVGRSVRARSAAGFPDGDHLGRGSIHPDALRRREEARRRREERRAAVQHYAAVQHARGRGGGQLSDLAQGLQDGKGLIQRFQSGLHSGLTHLLNTNPVKCISSQREFRLHIEEAMDEGQLVIAEFFGPWCKMCEELQPRIMSMAKENPDVLFLKVNAKEHHRLCREAGVRKVPCLKIYSKDQELDGVKFEARGIRDQGDLLLAHIEDWREKHGGG